MSKRRAKATPLMCVCGHEERLHRLPMFAPCMGTEGDLKDMDKMTLCDCKKFRAEGTGRKG